jgi:uncharacterized protein YjbJ (UPF0337 family)
MQLDIHWNVAMGKLKQKFSDVQSNDLLFVKGQEDEFVGRIQRRLGETRDEVTKLLDECSCECG